MTGARILRGDVLRFAAHYRGEKFHAALLDPPYHLTSVNSLGGSQYAKQKNGTPKNNRGFMGKQWDGGDIAFRPETWAAFASLLHDGAFVMAFASSRGWHRQAVAMEDAGLIIHPMIGWVQGQGFPKATRVKDSPEFASHRYGLQALKPALEPIIVAQVPYAGKPRERIVATGAGALNIDGGRIKTEQARPERVGLAIGYGANGHSKAVGETMLGRWPANLILTHTPDCNGTCAPDCPVRVMGEQSGESKSSGTRNGGKRPTVQDGYARKNKTMYQDKTDWEGQSDSGTAARFFYNADWVAEKIEAADPFFYTAKAGRKERDAGLDGMPLSTTKNTESAHSTICLRCGKQRVNVSGACDCQNPEWGRKQQIPQRNPHPCLKPISLTRHLATLLLPPVEYAPRRLLVPFCGVGSEAIGAMQAGWECIVGVEGEREYVEIAEKRLAYWAARQQPAQPELIK